MAPRAAILLESREQLARWVERYDLQCEFAELGLDYVFHDRRELDHLAAELPPLAEVGVAGEVIDGPAYLRDRSEEHTSELQSLMRISYAVFCLKKKKKQQLQLHTDTT